MTLTCVKNPVLQEWQAVFPEFYSVQGSCTFMKKLVAVSTSAITYFRGIFPEKAYGERSLSGLKLKILSDDCGIKPVETFIHSVRNCYDAIEKKYLRQLSIGICLDPENRNDVIEAYTLTFKYKDDECVVTCAGKNTPTLTLSDPTVNATLQMLQNIIKTTDFLDPLPKNAYITLKLLYYDNVTPEDYEPVGFVPSKDLKYNFNTKGMNVQIGKVETSQNQLRFLVKSTLTKALSQQIPEDPMADTRDVTSPEYSQEYGYNINGHEKDKSEDHEEDVKLSCPCKSKTDKKSQVVTCISCENNHHKICYGIWREGDDPEIFYCVDCMMHNTNDANELLDLVYMYQGKERQELCLARRALQLFMSEETPFVTKSTFGRTLGCSKLMGISLIKKFQTQELLKYSNKDKYIVQEDNIKNFGLEQYFPVRENKENEEINSNVESPEVIDLNYDNEEEMAEETEPLSPFTSVLETSINKVMSWDLSDSPRKDPPSTRSTPMRKAKKRKISDNKEVISQCDSIEQFQPVKKSRSRAKK